ncbi:hypothetical protein [uncultured Maribacter sp.]|uniref:hypothetical protein n=1 Tax=uncultured Maribacter sp. TaxID=431308 RepID=UPI0030DDA852
MVIQAARTKLKSTTLKDFVLYTSYELRMMCSGASYWAKFQKICYVASALQAKEFGFIYYMFYTSNKGARHKKFKIRTIVGN